MNGLFDKLIFYPGLGVFLLGITLGCGESTNVAPIDTPLKVSTELAETVMSAEAKEGESNPESIRLRVATYNVSLYRDRAGQLVDDLVAGNDKAHKIAHVIQVVRPDVLLLNEFDYDEGLDAITEFNTKYLGVGHDDAEAFTYPYVYSNEVNTGQPSGVDLDNDGATDGWNDCFGFGKHPGEYGMVVLSQFPIDTEAARTFQKFKWIEMPNAQLPTNPETGRAFYSDEALEIFRLSSKSHWDVQIDVKGTTLHFLVSHPTPPVFDGPEDRNGKRNHDEIRLFADYIVPEKSHYIVDDKGVAGGIPDGAHFVIAGDLNADPADGASFANAIRQLTTHPLVQSSPVPTGKGGVEFGKERANAEHKGDPSHDTADFDDRRTGNLRADYVLPSKTMKLHDAGIFWPASNDPHGTLIDASDHRLVWIDLEITN